MLQFNKSLATNTNAVYLDTVNTGSGYYDELRIAYSQSYDQSSGTFAVTATSTPTAYNNWLVFTNLPIVLPDNSGQYDVELWTSTATQLTWGETSNTWQSLSDIWSDVAGGEGLESLLYSDRAFISSSNEVDITTYVSSNEDAAYTTYNG